MEVLGKVCGVECSAGIHLVMPLSEFKGEVVASRPKLRCVVRLVLVGGWPEAGGSEGADDSRLVDLIETVSK
jgi:hypothetical protein